VIPREHRATLVVTSDATWNVLEELSALIKPMNYRAHFRNHRRHRETNRMEYVFELTWRRPERAGPPVELLQSLESRYQVNSFEVASENGL
jgi:putative Mg2+ transporter-C (MgtC) family protein